MNLEEIMKQAQKMQSQFAEAQDKMQSQQFQGKSGGNLVQLTISGKGNVESLSIDTQLLAKDEKTTLEDLLIAAFNDALSKKEEAMKGQFSGLGMPPGFKFPF